MTRAFSLIAVKARGGLPAGAVCRACGARQVTRIPRPAGVLVWTAGAVALHAGVPFQLSRLGGPARPASPAPAVRAAGLVTVAAGGALMAWAFAALCVPKTSSTSCNQA